MEIRYANHLDIDSICDIHRKSFSDEHFLTCLSNKKLSEYFKFLIDYNKYCFILFDSNYNHIAYLIAGDKTQFAINEFTKKNMIYIAFVLLIHPKFLIEKIRFLFSKIFRKEKGSSIKLRLISIAVRKDISSKNAGKEIIAFFENELIKDGIKEYGLSVRKNNHKAIKFYELLNFIKESETKYSFYFYKLLKEE